MSDGSILETGSEVKFLARKITEHYSKNQNNYCGSQYIFSFFLEYVAMCCIITNETGIESAGSLLILLPGISKAPVK